MGFEIRDFEVGPIWNQDHAAEKALQFEEDNPEWKWTGAWNTTIPDKMSVLKCVRRRDIELTEADPEELGDQQEDNSFNYESYL